MKKKVIKHKHKKLEQIKQNNKTRGKILSLEKKYSASDRGRLGNNERIKVQSLEESMQYIMRAFLSPETIQQV